MSADPETERAIYAAMERWMDTTRDLDVEATLRCYAPGDDISGLGTGPDEIAIGREALRAAFVRQNENTADARWRTEWYRVGREGPVAWVYGDADFSINLEGSPLEMAVRFTLVFVLRDGEWLLRHSHVAAPDPRQEVGEAWPRLDRLAAAVEREQPPVVRQLSPEGTVTLLFSDIENSTGLTGELGDLRWIEVLREHNAIVRDRVAAHGGTEVKTIGDAFMVAFPAARRALLCAIDLQHAFSAYNRDHPAQPIRLRIGMHAGEPVREGGDFYGKSVILASRIAAEASGDEILASALLRELTEAAGDVSFEAPRECMLKGFGEPQRVFPVRWRM